MGVMSPQQLQDIAADMNAMQYRVDAAVGYDLLSDSLLWSDEMPELGDHRPRDFWCLRPVLRYRTTLILGDPDTDFEEYWSAAQIHFPRWAGFQLSRCTKDLDLAKCFETLRSDGMASTET